MSTQGAYVLLADGTRFDGQSCGAGGPAVGEVVFTTGMSGYQESMTDPSFAAQLITFTYPQIGNYGASAEAMESDRVWARGAIMREASNGEDAPAAERGWLDWLTDRGVPAISGLDTRALVQHIREAGAMAGGIFPTELPVEQALALIAAEPPMAGLDLTGLVTPARMSRHGDGSGPRVAVLDTGIKGSIVRSLLARGARVSLYPCTASAAELLAEGPDAVLLPNGPGDPAALDHLVRTLAGLIGRTPVWGICLGHQLLSRALGLETFKLPFGHRGANHPVKDLATGRVQITSQNHGFAVLGPDGSRTLDATEPVRWETELGVAQLSHISLYDGTVEGIELLEVPGAAVQFHPEAAPGPHDSLYLFERFLESIA